MLARNFRHMPLHRDLSAFLSLCRSYCHFSGSADNLGSHACLPQVPFRAVRGPMLGWSAVLISVRNSRLLVWLLCFSQPVLLFVYADVGVSIAPMLQCVLRDGEALALFAFPFPAVGADFCGTCLAPCLIRNGRLDIVDRAANA